MRVRVGQWGARVAGACLLTLASASLAAAGPLHPDLARVLEGGAAVQDIPVIVTFRGRADLRGVVRGLRGKASRSRAVVRELRRHTRRGADRLLAVLPSGPRARARELWIVNGVALSGPPETIRLVAELPGVEAVFPDRVIQLTDPLPAEAVPAGWGVEALGAPPAWAAGYAGQGAVVAALDSGADLGHADIGPAWRGGANGWFDPNGEHPTPYDADGHGTQVLGLILGGDATGTAIGVAPGARWIAAKVFDDSGQAPLSSIYASLQWVLDPDQDPDTDDAPHVVNGSWSFNNPGTFLDPGVQSFREALQALRMADVLPVFAAGNSGPALATSESPANYPEAFAVGAHDEGGEVALFSARGPSASDGHTVYPDLVAPGVSVTTADLSLGGLFPDNTAVVSGTSFSTPHVAGAAALLLSADPALTADELEAELRSSTVDLGQAGPDHTSGWGRLDLRRSYVLFGVLPAPVACPGDLDTYPFQWTGRLPDGTPWSGTWQGLDLEELNHRLGGAWDGAATGEPGPEDEDRLGDGTFRQYRGVVCRKLGASDGYARMADGSLAYGYGYADLTGIPEGRRSTWGWLGARLPGPVLDFREGDRVYLTLTSFGAADRPDLPGSWTFSWEGLPQAAPAYGGAADASFAAPAGWSTTYHFHASRPGTYPYTSRGEGGAEAALGMGGALVVRPAQDGTALSHGGRLWERFAYADGDGSTGYDRDVVLVLGAVDQAFQAAERGRQPRPYRALRRPSHPLLNGRGYPDTVEHGPLGPAAPGSGLPSQPLGSALEAAAGERLLLRLVHLGAGGPVTLASPGVPLRVVGRDAHYLPAPGDLRATSVTLLPGQTADILVDTLAVPPGTYPLFARSLRQLNHGSLDRSGIFTELRVH